MKSFYSNPFQKNFHSWFLQILYFWHLSPFYWILLNFISYHIAYFPTLHSTLPPALAKKGMQLWLRSISGEVSMLIISSWLPQSEIQCLRKLSIQKRKCYWKGWVNRVSWEYSSDEKTPIKGGSNKSIVVTGVVSIKICYRKWCELDTSFWLTDWLNIVMYIKHIFIKILYNEVQDTDIFFSVLSFFALIHFLFFYLCFFLRFFIFVSVTSVTLFRFDSTFQSFIFCIGVWEGRKGWSVWVLFCFIFFWKSSICEI